MKRWSLLAPSPESQTAELVTYFGTEYTGSDAANLPSLPFRRPQREHCHLLNKSKLASLGMGLQVERENGQDVSAISSEAPDM